MQKNLITHPSPTLSLLAFVKVTSPADRKKSFRSCKQIQIYDNNLS